MFAIVNAKGQYVGVAARWDNPPRELRNGESVVECDDPTTLPQLGSSQSRIAPYEFQARFSDAELSAIQLSTDSIVIRGRTMLQTIRDDIDLTHPDTIQLLQYMTAIGLLTEERATEILS